MKFNEEAKRYTVDQLLAGADPEVKRLLTTPLNRLDKRYLNLLPPAYRGMAGMFTLQKFMNLYEETEGVRSYISFTGDKPTGWIVYRAEDGKIAEFDICSFIDGPNPVLLRDARGLFEDLKELYDVIQFQALPDNPFRKAYERIVKFYGGTSWEDQGMIWYQIGNDHLEEETSAASFTGTVPENISAMISLVDGGSVEQLKNLKGEDVDDL